ncbi:hypothetical protein OnM2_104017 [Erysiphe neolycopersici]|uniref:Mtf2-like C-terminal domain-containing protein n=1 Tax=Erysiphe neolycopersici TaxID=212602 RepID=A0A420H7W4_9PEZI|nr:hypothetical protein OnM2_104017 [Erysiphe neolycopersici]
MFRPKTLALYGLELKYSRVNQLFRLNYHQTGSNGQDHPSKSYRSNIPNKEVEKADLKLENEKQHEGPLVRRTTVVRGMEKPRFSTFQFNPDFGSFDKEPIENGNFGTKTSKFSDYNHFDYSVERQKDISIKQDEINEEYRYESTGFSDYNNFDYSENQLEDKCNKDNEGGENHDESMEESYLLNDASYDQLSTITPIEKRAFQKIFKDIFEKKHSREMLDVFGESFLPIETDDQIEEQTRHREVNEKIDDIITKSYVDIPKSVEEAYSKLQQYPPVLRASAAEAMGYDKLITEGNAEIKSENQNNIHNQNKENPELFGDPKALKDKVRKRELEKRIEAIREAERERVEAKMRAAKVDFDLWKVLDEEVFCLIEKLGLADLQKPKELTSSSRMNTETSRISKTQTLKESQSPVLQETETSLDDLAAKHNISPLQLYGPLYPYYLLLALRLLDRTFSRPSPLALALLPKIKSLGYISRVLGANIQFYNELLLIYRFRQNDFNGMLRLLEEMEMSSLNMNHETLDIVVQLNRVQDRVRQGYQGLGMSLLWGLPNFARGKFGPWRDYIREILETRQRSPKIAFSHSRPSMRPGSKLAG